MITCYINNAPIPAGHIGVRDLNFGQPVAVLQPLPYRLVLATAMIVEAMEPYYRDFAADDLQHGSPDDDPTTLALREQRWPALPTLARQSPELFVAFLRDHAAYELLTRLFRAPSSLQYSLNTVEAVEAQGDALIIAGSCYQVAA